MAQCRGTGGRIAKINVEQTIKRRISEKISAEMDLKRTTWEILTLEALHNEFGFGMDRLKRFTDALQASYDEYTRQAELTDTYKSFKATNDDVALINAIRGLRSYGIDYRKLLNVEGLFLDVDGKKVSVDAMIEKMEER